MKSRIIILLLVLMACLGASSLGAATFFIDSLVLTLPDDMELVDRLRLYSAETGVMDTLFDKGHIIFNNYVLPDESGNYPGAEQSLKQARKTDSDYLLRLEVDDNGAAWSFFSAEKGELIEESYTKVDDTDASLEERRRWMNLGNTICQEMLAGLAGSERQ